MKTPLEEFTLSYWTLSLLCKGRHDTPVTQRISVGDAITHASYIQQNIGAHRPLYAATEKLKNELVVGRKQNAS